MILYGAKTILGNWSDLSYWKCYKQSRTENNLSLKITTILRKGNNFWDLARLIAEILRWFVTANDVWEAPTLRSVEGLIVLQRATSTRLHTKMHWVNLWLIVCVLSICYCIVLRIKKSWALSQYKDRLSQVWGSHVEDKTVTRPSHL